MQAIDSLNKFQQFFQNLYTRLITPLTNNYIIIIIYNIYYINQGSHRIMEIMEIMESSWKNNLRLKNHGIVMEFWTFLKKIMEIMENFL